MKYLACRERIPVERQLTSWRARGDRPEEVEDGDRLKDFSAYSGGEVGLSLYSAITGVEPVVKMKDRWIYTTDYRGLSPLERMTIEDTVVMGRGQEAELGRLIEDVTDLPFCLKAGSLRKRFPDCEDLTALQEALQVIGVPDMRTLKELALKGWAYCLELAEELRAVDKPADEADSYSEEESEPFESRSFLRAVPITGHQLSAHEKGLPDPPWKQGWDRARDFRAKSFKDLAKTQAAFRKWYEPRAKRQGFSSVAKRFWETYRVQFCELACHAMNRQVIAWVGRIAQVPAEKQKLVAVEILKATQQGVFTEDQAYLVWKAWHKRFPKKPA